MSINFDGDSDEAYWTPSSGDNMSMAFWLNPNETYNDKLKVYVDGKLIPGGLKAVKHPPGKTVCLCIVYDGKQGE